MLSYKRFNSHMLYVWKDLISLYTFSSVQFSHSVMSDSLRPHELQHPRPPCPSPTPRACSNSCLSSQWCHPVILSSVAPIFSCLQSLPPSGSFLRSQLFASGGQRIGASASASVLPMNIQDWFPLGWMGLISLQIKHRHSPTNKRSVALDFFLDRTWRSGLKAQHSEN